MTCRFVILACVRFSERAGNDLSNHANQNNILQEVDAIGGTQFWTIVWYKKLTWAIGFQGDF